jgi:hypothetical protein
MGTCLFEKLLISKVCCIFAYLAVAAQHRLQILQYNPVGYNSADSAPSVMEIKTEEKYGAHG